MSYGCDITYKVGFVVGGSKSSWLRSKFTFIPTFPQSDQQRCVGFTEYPQAKYTIKAVSILSAEAPAVPAQTRVFFFFFARFVEQINFNEFFFFFFWIFALQKVYSIPPPFFPPNNVRR